MIDTRVIVQAIHYILTKAGPADKLKIVKLVFLADKLHLIQFGRTITEDSYWAMKRGPVGSTTLDILSENLEYLDEKDIEYSSFFLQKTQDSKTFTACGTHTKLNMLSDSDRKILDIVIDKFGSYSSSDLVNLTHEYTEWKQYEDFFENSPRSRKELKTEELFSTISDDPLDTNTDRMEQSREMFLGYC